MWRRTTLISLESIRYGASSLILSAAWLVLSGASAGGFALSFVFLQWFLHAGDFWRTPVLADLPGAIQCLRTRCPKGTTASLAVQCRGTLVACHRPARLRHPHSLTLYRKHLHQHARTHLTHGFLLYHSHLEPLCRTSLHRCSRLRLLSPVGPRIVGTHRRRLLRRFWGLPRLYTSRTLTPLRVHA